jgi:hypothetical protein
MIKSGGVKSPCLSGSRSAKRLGTIIEESLHSKGVCTFRPSETYETQALFKHKTDV